MHPHRLVGATAIVVGVLALAAPALAHIDPDPTDAQAGSEVSVGFTVEHGCDGSPTVQLDMRLPDGVTNPVAEPPDGWTGQVDGNIISFNGGPLPDDQELTFRVRMILPATPDTTIFFPFVQRCEVGEIRWIQIPSEGSGELDEPAPAMRLFGPVATTVPAPNTTESPSTDAAPTTTSSTAAPTTTGASTTSTASEPTSSDPSTTSDSVDDDSNGAIAAVLSIAAVVVVAGIVLLAVRRRRR